MRYIVRSRHSALPWGPVGKCVASTFLLPLRNTFEHHSGCLVVPSCRSCPATFAHSGGGAAERADRGPRLPTRRPRHHSVEHAACPAPVALEARASGPEAG